MRAFSTGTQQANLRLNFIPAAGRGGAITVYVGQYSDEAEYRAVEEKLRTSCLVWRNKEKANEYIVAPLTPDVDLSSYGYKPVQIDPLTNPAFTAFALKRSLHEHLGRLGLTKMGGWLRPFFVDLKENLLADVPELKRELRIGLHQKLIVAPHRATFIGKPSFGFTFNIKSYVRFDIPLDLLIKVGMDCRNLYVRLNPAAAQGDLSRFAGGLIGKVVQVNGSRLTLADTRDSRFAEVDAAACLPESKWFVLNRYFDAAFPRAANQLKENLRRGMWKLNAPGYKWTLIDKAVQKARGINTELTALPGWKFTLGQFLQHSEQDDEFKTVRLNKPTFSYDYESKKTERLSADAGLKRCEPYSRDLFAGRQVKVLILSPISHKGEVEQFIRRLSEGMRDPNVYNGFKAKYRLGGVEYKDHYFQEGADIAKAYREASLALLADGFKPDIVIAVIRKVFRDLPDRQNPYYVTKALWLSQGIPVQGVHIEKIRTSEYELQYILNNIALACYAKLGGTPWVIQATSPIRHELVIGIGRADDRESRLGPTRRVIGFTTVLKGNGDYLLSSCTHHTDWDQYEPRLQETIVKAVEQAAEKEGLTDGSELRLIFHLFKRTGRREHSAIQAALAQLQRFKIEFALVHLNDSHNFILADLANNQNGDQSKNHIAERGTCIEISENDRLVNFIGPKQYRGRGMSMPLLVSLNPASTFKDISYITQQVYDLSFMSWRSFFPSTGPVSLYYSSLIAGLSAKLEKIPGWNQDMIRTQLLTKRWFL